MPRLLPLLVRAPAILAAALLASCAHVGPEAAREVTVLVYNIHAGKDAGGADNLARVAEVVNGSGADLVLLQEVDRNTQRSGPTDQPATLARLTGRHAAYGPTIGFQGGEYGIALLSRWIIRHDTLIPLAVTPAVQGTAQREQRGLLASVVEGPGGSMVVLNTHLDASGDETCRVREMADLLRAAAELRERGLPLLLGGDFNARPESPVHEAVRAAGFRDAWTECGGGDGHTFPAAAPTRRIDYLYLPPGARCLDARVLPGEASDHRALLVRLRLPLAGSGASPRPGYPDRTRVP
jgi:endonuclease/exonuclease/phosphatase family metal-dependent hydrolase